MNAKRRYWSWKHKPGTQGGSEAIHFVERAIRNNCAMFQYEYDYQPIRMVTSHWKKVKKISVGDVIFLRGDDRIYAFGIVTRPRLNADVTLNIDKIVSSKSHNIGDKCYDSYHFKGVIHFKDSPVFYENLEEKENWGQRVDVESWRCYYPEGILAQSGGLYKDKSNHAAIREMKPEDGLRIMNQLKENFMSKESNLLLANGNIILHGAPGTGKTYLAKQIAREIILGKDDRSLMSGGDIERLEKQTAFTQFHSSYDYTDFVEGLRPVQKDGHDTTIGFKRKDGIFKTFCSEALKQPDDKFIFIIDEINRGDMSKIFGELLFALDPNYRGVDNKVKTQYQNLIKDGDNFKNGFFVPENVYIIGTMNDIDRSVDSMDFAMRRRFAFCEISAEDSQRMLENINSFKAVRGANEHNAQEAFDKRSEIVAKMNALNHMIVDREISLTEDYQIGAAYFLKYVLYADDEQDGFEKLWKNHLENVIKEYLRGSGEETRKLKVLHDIYTNAHNNSNDSAQNNG